MHFEPPPTNDMDRNRSIINLVNAVEDELVRSEVGAMYESDSRPKRVNARQKLLHICPGHRANNSWVALRNMFDEPREPLVVSLVYKRVYELASGLIAKADKRTMGQGN